MNFENVTQTGEVTYQVKNAKSYEYNINLLISRDSTNCKLSYIHGIGNLQPFDDKEKKEILDFLLSKSDGCVILNTISKNVADWIVKNYPTYYYNQPSIGYSGGVQHHICIKNTVKNNTYCKNPQPLTADKITPEIVREKLTKVLKQKRRKSDYVDDFIKSL